MRLKVTDLNFFQLFNNYQNRLSDKVNQHKANIERTTGLVIDEIMRQQHIIIEKLKSNEQKLISEQKKEPLLWTSVRSDTSIMSDTIKKLDEDIPNLSVALKLRFDGPFEIMGSMKRTLGVIDPANYNTISFDLNIIVFPEGKTFNILKIGNWFNLQVNRIASPSGHLTQYAYFIHFENGGKSGNAHSTNPLTCRSNVWQKVFLNLFQSS